MAHFDSSISEYLSQRDALSNAKSLLIDCLLIESSSRQPFRKQWTSTWYEGDRSISPVPSSILPVPFPGSISQVPFTSSIPLSDWVLVLFYPRTTNPIVSWMSEKPSLRRWVYQRVKDRLSIRPFNHHLELRKEEALWQSLDYRGSL